MSDKYANKAWIVGVGGIGTAVWDVLSERGWIVLATNENEADVRSHDSLLRWYDQHGPVGAVVYCAGKNYLEWSDHLNTREALDVYDVNVLGLVRVLQICSRKFLRRVVVVGSDAAHRPMRTSLAYNASKAALEAAVKVIARERASEDFAINIVSPGLVNGTPMTQNVIYRTAELRPSLDLRTYMVDQIPLGRGAWVEEIAEVVANTLETKTPYLNGATIEVNGAR